MRFAPVLAAVAVLVAPVSAEARNIVVSNDDGLTSNVVALYHALKEAGHDVIVSVPCRNQSGQGAALRIGMPLPPLTEPCLNNAAKVGDPAAGPMTRDDVPAGDFFYVDGTPIMALLYGLDVAGKARWNGAPDLVLSGPNEGQNVGSIAISSGTVSNAQFAALRGLPAIALSAGSNSEDADLTNPVSPEVARLSVELVAALEDKAGDGPLLPQGIALNVNFPDQPAGAAWRATRMGTYNTYAIGFTANMAEDASPTMRAMAEARGVQLPPLPGLSFDITAAAPAPGEENDEAYVYRTAIAVSPMQAGYAGDASAEATTAWQIGDLIAE